MCNEPLSYCGLINNMYYSYNIIYSCVNFANGIHERLQMQVLPHPVQVY